MAMREPTTGRDCALSSRGDSTPLPRLPRLPRLPPPPPPPWLPRKWWWWGRGRPEEGEDGTDPPPPPCGERERGEPGRGGRIPPATTTPLPWLALRARVGGRGEEEEVDVVDEDPWECAWRSSGVGMNGPRCDGEED